MHFAPGAVPAARRVTGRSGRAPGAVARWVGAAVAASSLAFASACGIGGGDGADGLAAGDYTVVRPDGVRNSVVVNGNVGPVRSTSVTTGLQAPVEHVAVGVGDRVSPDQLLVEINSEAAERQLAQQQQEQANLQADAMDAVNEAQTQLNTVQSQINQGTYPAIAQAQASASQAQAAYNAAAEAGDAAQQEQAYAALQEAKAQVDAAWTQAANERDQLQRQVNSAWRKAESAGNAASDGSLEYQVQASTVYAPMGGLVTSVEAKEGDVPQGQLLTIADDSRLIVHTKVREADIPNIAKGNRVTFTSTATGDEEFEGTVSWISPVGTTGEPNPQTGKADNNVTFPVDVEVTGKKEGLLLGGSARAEIITEEDEGALAVPLDSVYDDGGTKKVLVLAAGQGERSGTVEERTVTTGSANDVDVAVTGGDLAEGDIVINWPDRFRDRIGQTVTVNDANFTSAAAARGQG